MATTFQSQKKENSSPAITAEGETCNRFVTCVEKVLLKNRLELFTTWTWRHHQQLWLTPRSLPSAHQSKSGRLTSFTLVQTTSHISHCVKHERTFHSRGFRQLEIWRWLQRFWHSSRRAFMSSKVSRARRSIVCVLHEQFRAVESLHRFYSLALASAIDYLTWKWLPSPLASGVI